MVVDYEHTDDLRGAQAALIELRKRVRRLHWLSGGAGYDNMGARELVQVRVKLDEADMWLAAASRSLNAGGRRAVREGYGPGAGKDTVA